MHRGCIDEKKWLILRADVPHVCAKKLRRCARYVGIIRSARKDAMQCATIFIPMRVNIAGHKTGGVHYRLEFNASRNLLNSCDMGSLILFIRNRTCINGGTVLPILHWLLRSWVTTGTRMDNRSANNMDGRTSRLKERSALPGNLAKPVEEWGGPSLP